MINRYCLLSVLWATVLTVVSSTCAIAEDEPTKKRVSADRYLELGTVSGTLGGDRQKVFERAQIKAQILTFIPPLLRPALTQHAYVLPPGAFSVSLTSRFTEIDGDDFFRNGRSNRAVFGDFSVKRQFSDFDFFYGFDLNRKYLHGFTLRVNVPYLESTADGFVHPNGQSFISLENAGSTGFLVPSIIYSPDPQIRLTFTTLIRVVEPDLGPAPDWVIRTGMDVIF